MTTTAVHNPSRTLILAAAVATAAVGLALALRVPIGIPGQWIWRPNQLTVHLWTAALCGLLAVAAAWFITRPGWWSALKPAMRAVTLATLIVIVFALQCALLNASGLPWITPGAIIASPVATTYYSTSLDIKDPVAWLASYPEQMRSMSYHARTHPPGFMLFFLGLRRVLDHMIQNPPPALNTIAEAYRDFGIGPTPTDAAAAIAGAFIFAFIGALSLWPLYLLARQLLGADTAICSVALASALPALLLFGASSDELVLTLTVLTLWLSYSAWQARGLVRAFLAGLALAVGLFFTFGLFALAAWLLIWLIVGIVRSSDRQEARRRALPIVAAAAVGFIVFYLVLYVGFGYRAIAVAREGLFAHHGVTTVETARSYWMWLLMDPVEMVIFAGLPVVVAAIWSIGGIARASEFARTRLFLVAWLATVALLDLSGTVRGEVGRIWLFLLWPVAILAASRIAAQPRRSLLIAALLALQIWQAVLMRGYLTLYDIF